MINNLDGFANVQLHQNVVQRVRPRQQKMIYENCTQNGWLLQIKVKSIVYRNSMKRKKQKMSIFKVN